MAVRRALVAVLVALLGLAVLTGCGEKPAREHRAAPPPPGWLIAVPDGCLVTSGDVRATVDVLAGRRLAQAGYRDIYLACDGDPRLITDDDRDYVADHGMSLWTVRTDDERVRDAVDAAQPQTGLRTALTRAVMSGHPLTVSGDASATLPEENLPLLINPAVLAVARDQRPAAGARVAGDPGVFSRAIGTTGLLVSLTNTGDEPVVRSVAIADLNLAGDDSVPATDLWTGDRYRSAAGRLSVELAPGDSALLQIG
ncbi:hypothetical protein [Gordonia sp. (in: high G+C Gram-positive bacteria)]|uniref:hypothetical protein n=1 Tax=unclassified Gordonia (in: high G+C Gram-positive bacteria) TaxID=2657482 RepID=UPI002631FEE5|nr:hypothetical protein [Gordonia sp. (in: high G+C Gram-positive bacteria)]